MRQPTTARAGPRRRPALARPCPYTRGGGEAHTHLAQQRPDKLQGGGGAHTHLAQQRHTCRFVRTNRGSSSRKLIPLRPITYGRLLHQLPLVTVVHLYRTDRRSHLGELALDARRLVAKVHPAGAGGAALRGECTRIVDK
eukprot:5563486-Prymnesium_polylepis.1